MNVLNVFFKSFEMHSGPLSPSIKSIYQHLIEQEDFKENDLFLIEELFKIAPSECYTDTSAHLLVLSILLSYQDGSICLSCTPERLMSLLNLTASRTRHNEQHLIDSLHRSITSNQWPFWIGGPDSNTQPFILNQDRLYLNKYFHLEQELKENIIQRIELKHQFTMKSESLKELFNLIFCQHPQFFKDQQGNQTAVQLNHEQMMAVALALDKNLCIISGGPGTGKTSIVTAFLRVLCQLPEFESWLKDEPGDDLGDHIFLCAPTGRAAQRLHESICTGLASIEQPLTSDKNLLKYLKSQTLHRFIIDWLPHESSTSSPWVKSPARCMIIDEVSMIDAKLMNQILKLLSLNCKIILLGDANQLPSVENGRLFADLSGNTPPHFSINFIDCMQDLGIQIKNTLSPEQTPTMIDCKVQLHQSFRFNDSIKDFSERIHNQSLSITKHIDDQFIHRAGEPSESLLVDLNPGVHLICHDNHVSDWRKHHFVIDLWWKRQCQHFENETGITFETALEKSKTTSEIENQNLIKSLLTFTASSRILCFTHKGPCGTSTINHHLSTRLRQGKWHAKDSHFNGAPILIKQNSRELNLTNGDIGLVLQTDHHEENKMFAYFWIENTLRSFPVEQLPVHELAYAMTVHKSQGSEYDEVLLMCPHYENRLFCREVLFTAITRAKKMLWISTRPELLEEAQKKTMTRDSGLTF